MIDGVDLEALAGWMDERALPSGPIVAPTLLTGGTQNILVRFERGGRGYVLRRPPIHKRDNSDETMRREARVLEALAGTDVPHPRLLAACDDDAVLGGAFYLMEPVDGVNPTVELPQGYVEDRSWRWRLGIALADGAAAIATVDHVAVGLEAIGCPNGFLERQVSRWQHQLESYSRLEGYGGPDIPGLDSVGAWLDRNRPPDSSPGLIHGDYHMANVLCTPHRPALAAVVDWELATIGDPLLDLGWMLATWPSEADTPVASLRVRPWDGFPTSADLLMRYAERSDRDLSAILWYEVLACFKLGIILEGTHARAAAGHASARLGGQLHASALNLIARAVDRIAKA